MDFKEWWHSVGSGIRPAISSDMESHAQFVANAAWNAAQQNTKVTEQTTTNTGSPKLPFDAERIFRDGFLAGRMCLSADLAWSEYKIRGGVELKNQPPNETY